MYYYIKLLILGPFSGFVNFYTHPMTISVLWWSTYSLQSLRRVWRYQRGNQNPYIEEVQTTQWSKEKVLKDKQRSTKHTCKTKDRETRTPLKIGGELMCSGRVSSSCSTLFNYYYYLICSIWFIIIYTTYKTNIDIQLRCHRDKSTTLHH
jgi:hypothetical protein